MDKRVVITPRWEKTLSEFEDLCNKYGVKSEEYQQVYKRPLNWALESLLKDNFNEEFFFTLPDVRLRNAEDEFDKILILHGVDSSSYEIEYGHKKARAAFLLQCNQELDLGHWLTPREEPSKEDIYELASELLKEHGYNDPTEYALALRRKLSVFAREIKGRYKEVLSRDPKTMKYIEAKYFDLHPDPNRDPKAILDAARAKVPAGRTAGLTVLELGNKLKEFARSFYPGGMDALNFDLGLSPTVHIPDFEMVRMHAPTKVELRLEEINTKIDKISAQINPIRLDKLRDELGRLEEESGELQGCSVNAQILEQLEEVIEKALDITPGYLYFKQWSLPDAAWFKIGITNSPERRDSEQNVLPVPAQTLYLVRLDSMEHARSVEKAIHSIISSRRVVGAKNKEIFQLSGSDCKAVLIALRNLSDRLSQPAALDED